LPLASNGTCHEKYTASAQNNTKNISNILNRTTAASRWDMGLKDFNLGLFTPSELIAVSCLSYYLRRTCKDLHMKYK
jgi:hypothetical protein